MPPTTKNLPLNVLEDTRARPMAPTNYDPDEEFQRRAHTALSMPQMPHKMLDVVEANAGRQMLVTPDVTAAIGDLGRGKEFAFLDLNGDSRLAQVVTVVFASYDPRSWPDGALRAAEPGAPVGIIRFGNGGGTAEVEVDIPNPNSHANGQSYAANGVAISLPAGRMRVSVRDDSRIIPGTGQDSLLPDNLTGGQLISAHCVYGHRGSPSRLYRTLFFAINSLAQSDSVTLRVPPFSRSVRFVRHPKRALTAQLALGWLAVGGPFVLDEITVDEDAISPTYPIPPRVTQLTVTNDGPGDLASGMAVFEIAL